MYDSYIQSIAKSGESFTLTGAACTGKTSFLCELFLYLIEKNITTPDRIWFIPCQSEQIPKIYENLSKSDLFAPGFANVTIRRCGDLARNLLLLNATAHRIPVRSLRPDLYQTSKGCVLSHILQESDLPHQIQKISKTPQFVRNILNSITFLENTLIEPSSIKLPQTEKWFFDVVKRYRESMSVLGLLYREDILARCIELCKSNIPGTVYVPPVDYIFVDDMHNLAALEYDMLLGVRRHCSSVKFILCGASAETLQGYRGCSSAFFKRCATDFSITPKNRLILSHSMLPHATASIISQLSTPAQIDHEPEEPQIEFSEMTEQGVIECITLDTVLDQAVWVASTIGDLLRQERYNADDIAILLPRHDQESDLLRAVLFHRGIPVVAGLGVHLNTTQVFSFIDSCITLITEGMNDVLMKRILRSPVLHIEPLQCALIERYAKRNSLSLCDASMRFADVIDNDSGRNRLLGLVFLFRKYKCDESAQKNLSEVLSEIVDRADVADFLTTADDIEIQAFKTIISSSDYFNELLVVLRGTLPKLADYADFKEFVLPSSIRAHEADEAAVRILSYRECEPYHFKAVFMLSASAANLSDENRAGVPLFLLNRFKDSHKFELSGRTTFAMLIARASEKLYMLYPRETGDMSVFFELVSNCKGTCNKEVGTQFENFDEPTTIRTQTHARIWFDRIRQRIPSEYISAYDRKIASIVDKQSRSVNILRAPQARLKLPDEYVFKPSHIDGYLKCPRKYLYEHLFEIETDNPEEPKLFGTLMHSVLELLHSRYPDWCSVSEEDIQKRYDFARGIVDWKLDTCDVLNSFNKAILYNQSIVCLDNYFDVIRDEIPFRIESVEKKIRFRIDDIPFSIKIDRIDSHISKAGVRIIDYKTSSKKQGERSLKNSIVINKKEPSVQLSSYYHAVKELLHINPAELGIFYLQAPRDDGSRECAVVSIPITTPSNSTSVSPTELEEAKRFIVDTVNAMKLGDFTPDRPNCHGCPFTGLCRYNNAYS